MFSLFCKILQHPKINPGSASGYDQKPKLFRNNSFVLAQSSAKKKKKFKQLTVKSSIQWSHMIERDVI